MNKYWTLPNALHRIFLALLYYRILLMSVGSGMINSFISDISSLCLIILFLASLARVYQFLFIV